MARKPFLMSKREKALWGALNGDEQRAWWRWFIVAVVSSVLFLAGGSWLLLFCPSSEVWRHLLVLVMLWGGWLMFYAQGKVSAILADRILSRLFYQRDGEE